MQMSFAPAQPLSPRVLQSAPSRSVPAPCATCRVGWTAAIQPLARFATHIRVGSLKLRCAAADTGRAAQNSGVTAPFLLPPPPGSEQLHRSYGVIRSILEAAVDCLDGYGERRVQLLHVNWYSVTGPHPLVAGMQTVTRSGGWSDVGGVVPASVIDAQCAFVAEPELGSDILGEARPPATRRLSSYSCSAHLETLPRQLAEALL